MFTTLHVKQGERCSSSRFGHTKIEQRRRRLFLEALEDRRLLAPVTITISDASAVEGGTTGKLVDVFIPGPGIAGELFHAFDFDIGPDGNLYVPSAETDEILRYDRTTGDLIDVFVPADLHGPDSPYGLAFAPDGKLYVASYNTDEIRRYNGSTGAYIDTLISGGRIRMPGDLTFAPDGSLYVANIATDEVLRYNAATGELLNVVMSANDGLDEPRAMLVRGGQLYVSSMMNDQVLRYDGNAVSVFVPTASGGLSYPAGLDYGPDGNLYVASLGSDTILRYDGTTGAYMGVFKALSPPSGAYSEDGGMNGPMTLQFVSGELYVVAIHPNLIARYDAVTGDYLGALATSMRPRAPKGIAFGPDGSLYVNNFCGASVTWYEGQSGTFLGYIVEPNSGGYREGIDLGFGPDGNIYTIDVIDSIMFRFNGVTGEFMDVFIPSGSGGLIAPRDSVFHTDGNLYVTSESRNAVDRFDSSTGQFIDTFVAPGSGGLSGPYSLVFGPDGSLFVYSRNTGKVLRYSGTTGAFMGVFAEVGPYHQQNSMAFGPDGNLYVSQYEGDSVKRFDGTTGAYIDDFVAPNEGGVFWPTSLAFDALGTLYVANQGPKDSGYVMRFTTTDHAVFNVTLSESSNVPVTVDYSTGNGTADAGSDFVALSGTLTFMPGETSKSIIVPTINDSTSENAETFLATLSNPTGGALLGDAQGVATIVANDPQVLLFADSFENGQWNGLWVQDSQNDWFTSTQRATDGSHAAEVDGSTSDSTLTIASPINLTAHGSAELSFDWLIESGLDPGEYLALDLFNGTSWQEVAKLRGNVDAENVWHSPVITLDGSYLVSNFQFRFRGKMSGADEDADVDNVRLVATRLPGPNTPPVALDESATTSTNISVVVPVLKNDFDPDDDKVTIMSVSTPTHGTAVISGDSVTYTPTTGYTGNDAIAYTISDGRGGTDTGSVLIDVVVDSRTPEYVYDIRFETTKINATQWQVRAVYELRLDSNADGQATADDMAASWAALNVNFNGQYYSGNADSDGRFVTPYVNMGPGTYCANVLWVVNANLAWHPLVMDQEDDSDGDGKPDGVLELTTQSMHVSDLDRSARWVNSKKWTATVVANVLDATGLPVPNATLQGTWSNGATGSATTNSAGQATLLCNNLDKSINSVTFTVTNITHASFQYAPASNADPDGDSNGTVITVAKPAALLAANSSWGSVPAGNLTEDVAQAAVSEALLLWSQQIVTSFPPDVHIQVADIPTGFLGWASGNTITLDVNADGAGWYTDLGAPAAGRVDLLTVVSHEIGHLLGYGHSDVAGDLMYETLTPGTRRLPGSVPVTMTAMPRSGMVSSLLPERLDASLHDLVDHALLPNEVDSNTGADGNLWMLPLVTADGAVQPQRTSDTVRARIVKTIADEEMELLDEELLDLIAATQQ